MLPCQPFIWISVLHILRILKCTPKYYFSYKRILNKFDDYFLTLKYSTAYHKACVKIWPPYRKKFQRPVLTLPDLEGSHFRNVPSHPISHGHFCSQNYDKRLLVNIWKKLRFYHWYLSYSAHSKGPSQMAILEILMAAHKWEHLFLQNYGTKLLAYSCKKNCNPHIDIYHVVNGNVHVGTQKNHTLPQSS